MNRLESLARRLVLCWGLALGCGEGTSDSDPVTPSPTTTPTTTPAAPSDPAAVYAEIADDMARLRALQIVEVRALIVNTAAESSGCYGLHPCEGSAAVPVIAAEYARQAPRLDHLAALAEGVAARSYGTGTGAEVAADIAALNALEIVSFGALITVAAANDPSCYSLPCPEEVARAEAENTRRRATLHALALEATAARP